MGVATNEQMIREMKAMGLKGEELEAVVEALARTRRGPGLGETELSPEVREIVAKTLAAGRQQTDMGAMLDSLHCTDEMIAEQQAALEAAGG